MKEQRYTLLDDYYFDVLRVVVEAFENSGYRPIMVGGVAVQAHIIGLVGFENAGKYMRKTDDYDMVVLGIENKKVEEIISALNGASFITENAIFSVSVLRNGSKRPVLKVEYLNGENEIKNATIHLNIFTKLNDLDHIPPERAEIMYMDAVETKIKHSRTLSELKAMVLRIEDLIATKIAKRREKDREDVSNLVEITKEKGMVLDWRRTEDNLRSIKDRAIRERAVKDMKSFEDKPVLIAR